MEKELRVPLTFLAMIAIIVKELAKSATKLVLDAEDLGLLVLMINL